MSDSARPASPGLGAPAPGVGVEVGPPPEMSRVADSPLLVALSDDQVTRFLAAGETRRYPAGSRIIARGEPGDALYLILGGRVSIRHAEDAVVATLSGEDTLDAQYEGDFFGEMSVLDHEPRSATVVAGEAGVEVFRIAKDRVFALFAEDTDFQVVFLLNMARILSRRLRRSNLRRAGASGEAAPRKE